MRNKIMMLVLLCALLVGLVPPSSARAGVEDFPDLPSGFNYEYYYAKEWTTGRYYLYGSELPFYFSSKANGITSDVDFAFYEWNGSSWSSAEIRSAGSGLNHSQIMVSNHDILYQDGTILFQANVVKGYSFANWCKDAGLNCVASSNENNTVLPYVFNDYVHVVRRTGMDKYGRWVLTTIGNSIIGENLSDYTLMVDDTGELQVYALYSGEEEQGYQLFVRNYIYDTDGWKLISFELFDTREDDDFIIELGEDSAINDANLLAYTSVDIYDNGLNLLHSASTEYYDVNDILPDVPEQSEKPSITPTVPPSGGSGDTNDRDPNGPNSSANNDVTVPKFDIDWNDVKLDDIPDVIRQIKDAVLGFFDIVGVVPLMIGAVFGFLPSWCLWMFGLSFALLGVLLVIKLIRG